MHGKLQKYLRMAVCILVGALVIASPDFDAYGKTKRRKKSRVSRTSKRRRSSKKKSRISSRTNLPVVVLGAEGPIDAPEPFVLLPQDFEAPDGLDGRTVALWPSHGKYSSGGWVWQRPRLFGTVEDLLSRSFIDPYIVPMLENAGAYVMMPRERDFSRNALIIDHDRSSSDGRFVSRNGRYKWEEEGDSTGYLLPQRALSQGENPFERGSSGVVRTVEEKDSAQSSYAAWYGTSPQEGERAVYVSYKSYPNSATDATYTVNHAGGASKVVVNQQMGGGTWVYIGSYTFPEHEGKLPLVTLSNVSADEDAVVSADAVKIGGGMGMVARSGGSPSGYPAYLEGARYYLQSAGFPQFVYSESNGENDYTDDYKSRALWVNHLTGGSDLFPDTLGLGVPVDMVLALHTDAGITTDSTTIGTLGLYSTDSGNPLGNGTSRYANRDLAQSITSQVVSDIRELYDPNWRFRGNLDRKYYEIRETKVPAMIIELLSHQNFEDMKRAWDPEFRFIAGRAVYKGILKFLAGRYDQPFVVQPLPVEAFAISADGDGYYTLTWQPQHDKIEPTATPTGYIVYEATPDRYFHPVAYPEIPSWTTRINDDKIHAYYVVATNSGGASFPSETLALYDNNHRMPSVEIVNGFTRVSGPEWVDGESYAGFDFANRYGVPDGSDVHFIGEQYDFDPASKLINGSSPGFGASRDYEADHERYGNTRDYTIVHGEALRRAKRGFVSSSLKAFEQSKNTPKAVDLILGLQKTTRKAPSRERYFQLFPERLRNRLIQYQRNGGKILLSGSYLSSEIQEADSLTREEVGRFASEVLGYQPYLEGDSILRVPPATDSYEVTPSEVMRGVPALRRSELASLKSGNWVGAGNPQAIRPADDKGLIIGRFADTQLPAAVAVAGQSIVVGFPLETMTNDEARERFIGEAIEYLIGPEVAMDLPKTVDTQSDKPDKKKKGKGKKEKKPKVSTSKASSQKNSSNRTTGKDSKTESKDSKGRRVASSSETVPPKPQSSGAPRAVPHRHKKP